MNGRFSIRLLRRIEDQYDTLYADSLSWAVIEICHLSQVWLRFAWWRLSVFVRKVLSISLQIKWEIVWTTISKWIDIVLDLLKGFHFTLWSMKILNLKISDLSLDGLEVIRSIMSNGLKEYYEEKYIRSLEKWYSWIKKIWFVFRVRLLHDVLCVRSCEREIWNSMKRSVYVTCSTAVTSSPITALSSVTPTTRSVVWILFFFSIL